MAWVKIPAENHPLFHAALPKDPRISTIQMFGGVASLVNGNMFGGLFARAAIVKLGEADYAQALALDGAEKFDPMGTGRIMSSTVLLPETIMDEPGELRDWLRKAFDYTVTLPRKQKKGAKAAKAAKAAKGASGAKGPKAAKGAKGAKAAKPATPTRPSAAARSTTATKKRVAKAPVKARRATRT